MSKTKSTIIRESWGKEEKLLPKLDLLAIQKNSYKWFIDKAIGDVLNEVSPINDFTDKNWSLSFDSYRIGKPSISPADSLKKGSTFDAPLYVETTLTNKREGTSQKQEIFLGDIPQMTDRGTFIISGIERAVINQIVRSSGAFFTATPDAITGKVMYNGEIRPMHGVWLEFSTTRQGTIMVKIDRRRKFPVTTLLRALGLSSNEDILARFADIEDKHDFIKQTLEKDGDVNDSTTALIEIFKKLRPGEPVVIEKVRESIHGLFFHARRYDLGEVGRYKVNKKLSDIPHFKPAAERTLTLDDLVGAVSYLILLANGDHRVIVDDIDSLAHRRVRSVGELVATTAFRVGVLRLERAVKERMSLLPFDQPVAVSSLINARPIVASLNEFFRTSQLSSILDQTNPLSEVEILSRLTVMGSGGIQRDRAAFSIRDINASQYGRVCPVKSPEGPNIGLVTYLTLYAKVNDYGFLETPYRKVVNMKATDEILYMDAADEAKYYITHAGVLNEKDEIALDRVPARFRGEFIEIEKEKVSYVDVSPRQVIGASAALIPFIAHDEAQRALMGTHFQWQAVPLIKPESPIVGTGMEGPIAEVMGKVIRAPFDGEVVKADANGVLLEGKNEKAGFPIESFLRTSSSTAYTQRLMVKPGDRVKKGDLLIDGPSSENGELALGQNLLIAYMSYQGLEFEDAIVISDRLVKEDTFSSIHIERYESNVVDTKLGPEELTRDLANVAEDELRNLDEHGIVYVGAEVGPGSILVGKIAPKGETELTAEERLLRAIFGEQAREVRDTSLRMPHGDRGIVTSIQILDRKDGVDLEPGTLQKIIVEVAQLRHVVVGDKVAGRHGNKGVVSRILPEADMPYIEGGRHVDIIIRPASVLARMNLGQVLEAHLGFAAQKLERKVALPVFDRIDENKIVQWLKEAGLPTEGKMTLFDGRTGEAMEHPVVVGIEYIMKLNHMVEDKTHARSTGPYSLVTQQPLGGKAQMGGQRLGEMEVWALEAHRARYILQEMLTIKSDDVVGRSKAFEAMVKGSDIPTPMVPESFNVLMHELEALGINVKPVGASVIADDTQATTVPPTTDDTALTEEEKLEKETQAFEKALGAGESEPENGTIEAEDMDGMKIAEEEVEPSDADLAMEA